MPADAGMHLTQFFRDLHQRAGDGVESAGRHSGVRGRDAFERVDNVFEGLAAIG
jgi:hypothetical protein